MEHNWTGAQLSAIETSDSDILVSAGAGSGKTAVLTERIIRRLTDTENPVDITRMLVVTFTQAAASELKERISSAITKAIAESPKNKRLQRQLLSLERAKISTIHSFCLDILREGIGGDDIPASFRIADEAEITLLRKSIMDELIEEYYSTGVEKFEIENFPEFAQIFVGTKSDDSLADTFLKIEKMLASFAEYTDFIKNFADKLSDMSCPFEKTDYGKEIFEHVRGKMMLLRDMLTDVLPAFDCDEIISGAHMPAFSSDIDYIDKLCDACTRCSYNETYALMAAYPAKRVAPLKNVILPPEVENARAVRQKFKDERKNLATRFFSLDEEQLKCHRTDVATALYKLYTLLTAFASRFDAQKRRRNLLDFDDLERFAYKLLIKDGQPSDTAREIAGRFDEIYIDEYQDVNAVQDAIFKAVGNGHNRFMVGDIKQSIYSFRGANPHIFAGYRRDFTVKNPDDRTGTAIFLSDNFRCDDKIIKFANLVSECLFTSGRGDIPFTNDDLLIHSKKDTERGEPVHVVLINQSEADEEDDVSELEAEYVANEIQRLLAEGKKNNGEPLRPGDIAIIMRGDKAYSPTLCAALDAHGIPNYSGANGDFFANAEVLLALCILNIIDNPTRDIYLAGALKSPVYGFTLDELVKIRNEYSEGYLYDALREYCKTNNFKKGQDFLASLDELRHVAEGLAVDKLLWHVYKKTDMLALVYDSSNSVRRANLMMLYEYARAFEASSFKGLHNFLRYVNDVIGEKVKLQNAKEQGEGGDTVKIMSVHHSKGLEFPVCFICSTGKKFNDDDIRKNIVIERSLGIALKLSDSTGLVRYNSPIRYALASRLAESLLEEEMRILYVAMTRARERLYVTALVKDANEVLSAAQETSKRLSRYTVMTNKGYMHWILTAIKHFEATGDSTAPYVVDIIPACDISEGACSVCKDAELSPHDEIPDLSEFVKERMDFVYANGAASRLPSKLSVSKLLPNLLDADTAELDTDGASYSFVDKRPLFLDSDIEAPTASGAERGSATHLFMQFCDFSHFNVPADELAECVENEALRLAENKFITRRMASLVNIRQAAAFFAGETFREICAAKNVWREHRFNVRLPAADFTEDENLARELGDQTLLVQGVIDCFYENPDGTITLIDYKTDFIPPNLSFDEACALLLERHRLQLMYYRSACERISAKKVSRTAIYSFSLGCPIDVV